MSALEQLVGNMTVAQLAESAGMTIDEIVGLVLKRGASRGSSGRKAASPRSSGVSAQNKTAAGSFAVTERTHHTRTQAGRDALDEAILAILKNTGEPMRAVDVREAVGGTAAQVRARLNTLIEGGKLAYKGRASGTRYWIK
jgi:hypothetical protein